MINLSPLLSSPEQFTFSPVKFHRTDFCCQLSFHEERKDVFIVISFSHDSTDLMYLLQQVLIQAVHL